MTVADYISQMFGEWGERRDSNPRSPGPQPGALTYLATLTTAAKSLASPLNRGQFRIDLILSYVLIWDVKDSSKSSTIMSVFVWCRNGN